MIVKLNLPGLFKNKVKQILYERVNFLNMQLILFPSTIPPLSWLAGATVFFKNENNFYKEKYLPLFVFLLVCVTQSSIA